MARKTEKRKQVETLTHEEAKRKNIPTAEYQSVMKEDDQSPVRVAYERRNRDLDPQLVWRGKDEQDQADLVVPAPPLFIQEKVHPKALIDDLVASSPNADPNSQPDLFADFNGLPDGNAKTEFYQHDANWSNRMILGDSLQVMTSLAEREGLRGKVQCIYIDPPYGIKFNSNFQWSTTSRDVKDGKADHITREPEQVKAFRDTWRDGIHSYLTYLRDRLTVARDLLTESGSVFVQIGDENVHRVRALMDDVFGEDNFVSQILYQRGGFQTGKSIANTFDHILWFARSNGAVKVRPIYIQVREGDWYGNADHWVEFANGMRISHKSAESIPAGARLHSDRSCFSATGGDSSQFKVTVFGTEVSPPSGRGWSTSLQGIKRLLASNRIMIKGTRPRFKPYYDDFPLRRITNGWMDTVRGGFTSGGEDSKVYVVQTGVGIVQRCILMTTDPGDLVLDPTCGSGTTAYVAEQWGRRWITIDTSRVALALARARVMGARYPYYLVADSPEGRKKSGEWRIESEEQEKTHHSSLSTHHSNVRQGFVYERVPHVTLKSIANNAEIDVIWEKYQAELEPLRERLNKSLKKEWEEWEIPRDADDRWPAKAKTLHAEWWTQRIARQKEIDASIAAKADYEHLYDKPYEDTGKVRVAGPFTVESLSPHRVLGVDENDELIDSVADAQLGYGEKPDFVTMILDNLRTAGVQQAHKDDRIVFSSLTPWPGKYIGAEGRIDSGLKPVASDQKPVISGSKKKPRATDHGPPATAPATEKRAAIFIGPEFGTVSRPDLVAAAREAAEAGFDVLVACAFNYDARASEFNEMGRIPILKARMNADLHMADDLKNTGKGNLFVIFGEPDIEVASEEWLVDRTGRNIAPYDIFKLISGTDSLAEINGLDGKNLRSYAALSCRGEIWDYIADATCHVLGTDKRRGRTGKALNRRISSVAWHCAGLAGGTGNLCDLMRKAGADTERDFRELVGRLCRDQQNAQRDDQVSIHSPLTTLHFCQITIHGVDVFHPNTGDVRSDGPDGIACWFIDTDYNEESFFVRHAYFLGTNDPYSALKTTLKAEINQEAWGTLHSDTSRPFPQPPSGRIAVKVINHLGDEVMKVFRV